MTFVLCIITGLVSNRSPEETPRDHPSFTTLAILILCVTLILFLRSRTGQRTIGYLIEYLIFDEWKNLPIVRSVINTRARRRLKEQASLIPFSEIQPKHIQVMDIERLAEYIVWLIRATDGIPKERTAEETLDMLRKAETGGYLKAVRTSLYYLKTSS
jgi:hypothetical protein